jgi:hypothetical protein
MLRVTVLFGCIVLAACAPAPVKWDSEQRTAVPEVGARLVLAQGGSAEMTPAWQPPTLPKPMSGAAICDGSIVATTARGDTAFAAWWSPRADSTASLMVARSDDGGLNWRAPETADSTDRGHTGCGRPAPFIAADTTNGYVHVVYFMLAAEGPGIFFTHSMGGGEMFHSPVPIVYGERASASAVAVNGDTVAVAYIDPNAATPQLWLALSQTTGHIFETRMEVSPSTVQAARPAVAVRGHAIAVAWLETNRSGDAAVMVERTGRWK